MSPTVGRTVLYTMSQLDADTVNQRREHGRRHMQQHREAATGVMVHVGNTVSHGDVYPMVITRVWGAAPSTLVNGTVMLDGSDTFWACSRGVGEAAGMWHWPEVSNHAKKEAQ